MGRIAFGIGAFASALFLGWYGYMDNQNPGFSFAVGFIVLTLITTTFALAKSKDNGITGDGKGAGWTAFFIACAAVAYMFVFKVRWLIPTAAWAACQLPGVIAAVISRTAEEKPPAA
jgi:hypothetical protein